MTGTSRLQRFARDPYASSVAVIVGLGIVGLLAIAMGASGAADAATLDAQLPYVVSGGFGGLSLVVVAAGLHVIQRRRLAGARRRAELTRLLEAATAVLAEARTR